MKKILVCLLGIAMLFTVTSCATTKNADDLVGEWEVVSLEKNGEALNVVDAYIGFEAEKDGAFPIHGMSGVNLLTGSVKADDEGNFEAKDRIGSTMMMGVEEANVFETNFLECLTTSDSFDIKDNTLTISSSETNSKIVFNRK